MPLTSARRSCSQSRRAVAAAAAARRAASAAKLASEVGGGLALAVALAPAVQRPRLHVAVLATLAAAGGDTCGGSGGVGELGGGDANSEGDVARLDAVRIGSGVTTDGGSTERPLALCEYSQLRDGGVLRGGFDGGCSCAGWPGGSA